MKIQIKRLSDKAIIPTQNKKFDAGYDLYAAEDVKIQPHTRSLVKTNISMAIPQGYYGRIADRSGNAYKKGLHCLAGVIDASYTGDIGVVLFNTDKDLPSHILEGDRVAQIIIEKCHDVDFVEVDELNPTDRGSDGFGSSGN